MAAYEELPVQEPNRFRLFADMVFIIADKLLILACQKSSPGTPVAEP